MWVQFLPGYLHRLAVRRIERQRPNVEVAGETPVGPTILIAPWRNTSAVGFDPTGHRGIRWGAANAAKAFAVMHWFGKPDNSARIRVVAPFAPVLQEKRGSA
jgi:hypothetical protein